MSRRLNKDEQAAIILLQNYLLFEWDESYYFKITTDNVVIDRAVTTEIPMTNYVEE